MARWARRNAATAQAVCALKLEMTPCGNHHDKTPKWAVGTAASPISLLVAAAVGGFLILRNSAHPQIDADMKRAGPSFAPNVHVSVTMLQYWVSTMLE